MSHSQDINHLVRKFSKQSKADAVDAFSFTSVDAYSRIFDRLLDLSVVVQAMPWFSHDKEQKRLLVQSALRLIGDTISVIATQRLCAKAGFAARVELVKDLFFESLGRLRQAKECTLFYDASQVSRLMQHVADRGAASVLHIEGMHVTEDHSQHQSQAHTAPKQSPRSAALQQTAEVDVLKHRRPSRPLSQAPKRESNADSDNLASTSKPPSLQALPNQPFGLPQPSSPRSLEKLALLHPPPLPSLPPFVPLPSLPPSLPLSALPPSYALPQLPLPLTSTLTASAQSVLSLCHGVRLLIDELLNVSFAQAVSSAVSLKAQLLVQNVLNFYDALVLCERGEKERGNDYSSTTRQLFERFAEEIRGDSAYLGHLVLFHAKELDGDGDRFDASVSSLTSSRSDKNDGTSLEKSGSRRRTGSTSTASTTTASTTTTSPRKEGSKTKLRGKDEKEERMDKAKPASPRKDDSDKLAKKEKSRAKLKEPDAEDRVRTAKSSRQSMSRPHNSQKGLAASASADYQSNLQRLIRGYQFTAQILELDKYGFGQLTQLLIQFIASSFYYHNKKYHLANYNQLHDLKESTLKELFILLAQVLKSSACLLLYYRSNLTNILDNLGSEKIKFMIPSVFSKSSLYYEFRDLVQSMHQSLEKVRPDEFSMSDFFNIFQSTKKIVFASSLALTRFEIHQTKIDQFLRDYSSITGSFNPRSEEVRRTIIAKKSNLDKFVATQLTRLANISHSLLYEDEIFSGDLTKKQLFTDSLASLSSLLKSLKKEKYSDSIFSAIVSAMEKLKEIVSWASLDPQRSRSHLVTVIECALPHLAYYSNLLLQSVVTLFDAFVTTSQLKQSQPKSLELARHILKQFHLLFQNFLDENQQRFLETIETMQRTLYKCEDFSSAMKSNILFQQLQSISTRQEFVRQAYADGIGAMNTQGADDVLNDYVSQVTDCYSSFLESSKNISSFQVSESFLDSLQRFPALIAFLSTIVLGNGLNDFPESDAGAVVLGCDMAKVVDFSNSFVKFLQLLNRVKSEGGKPKKSDLKDVRKHYDATTRGLNQIAGELLRRLKSQVVILRTVQTMDDRPKCAPIANEEACVGALASMAEARAVLGALKEERALRDDLHLEVKMKCIAEQASLVAKQVGQVGRGTNVCEVR
jgi:hypothetical protein